MISTVALVSWAVFGLVGCRVRFWACFAVTTFAFSPLLILQVASTLTVLVLPESVILPVTVGSIILMALWVMVLLVIGYRSLYGSRS